MTKKISLVLSLFAALFLSHRSWAQADATKSFTLKEAQDYALKNNVNNLNATLDDLIAKNYNKEIRGIGFPQINGSFDVKDFVEIPTSLIPAEFFGGAPGSYAPVKFGTRYNATAGISASQIIFSSDYFLALKASKALLELSYKSNDRTKIETQIAVAKAYYGVLVYRQRLKLMYANVDRVRQLKDDTKALFDNGIVESIDNDRVELTYNNLLVEKEKVERLVALTEYALKFQMGMEITTPITLTDSLNLNAPINTEINFNNKPTYANRIEYQLLQNQEKLNRLELKRYRLNYLPSIAAYGSVSAAAQRSEFDIFDTNKGWYPTGVIGATLNLPIFDGFQKHFKSQQAKLKIQKTQNSLKSFESAMDLDVASASANFQNAQSSLGTQKKNMALAENVYNVSKIKYTEGVGTNTDVVTAETALKEAQTNYYSALYDYLISKVDWDRANGNIK
ncbi:MAG: TolC family protein [Bacteroidetes bacterium]|nr:TolC family protein [Bacteroidota bacterium]